MRIKGNFKSNKDASPFAVMAPPTATMDSFSFLKYLRSGGRATAHPTASVLRPSDDTEEEEEHDQDDGPFFDLEFAAMTDDGDGNGEGEEWEEKNRADVYHPTGPEAEAEAEEDEEEVETEFNFAVSAEGSGGAEGGDGLGFDAFSPSDDLFFKGNLVPFDPSSAVIAAVSEVDAKNQIPAYILRTATKVRIFFLGLRKTKPSPAESNAAVPEAPVLTSAEVAASPKKGQPQLNKFFVKFKVVDVPFGSFFARDGSTRGGGGGSREANPPAEEATAAAVEAEKKLVKEMVQKYLNKIKPLYVRVSRKYAERLRLAVHLTPTDEAEAETAAGDLEDTDADAEVTAPPLPQSADNTTGPTPQPGSAAGPGGRVFSAGLRVVCKRLGKSRSASAVVSAVASPATRRRDDSLLQQQDGIQSAIAHCKRSFTAAEQEGSESPLVRSMSDPGNAAST